MSLSDQVLVKGNHLAALKHRGETLEQMVLRVRRRFGKKMKIEIEVETLKELKNILPLSADIIMLDNMTLSQIRAAVKIVKHFKAFKPQLEVSGGVSLKTVRQIAQTGVDRISIGALTHSAPALDMALELN
jgi:nicotinate-nucleotide pyrophosphorylase (carboxylating)